MSTDILGFFQYDDMQQIIFAIIFMLFTCSAVIFAQTNSKAAELEMEFTLKVNESANFAPEKLGVEFVSVLNDSRCPAGVNCIWAGNAEVQIKVRKGNSAAKTFSLNTNLEPQKIIFECLQIELVDLTQPSENETKSFVFQANFIVRKN